MYDSDTFTGEGRSPVDLAGSTFVDPQQTPTDRPPLGATLARQGSLDSETDFELVNSNEAAALEGSGDCYFDLEDDQDLHISLNWVDLGSAKFCPHCRALLEVIGTKVSEFILCATKLPPDKKHSTKSASILKNLQQKSQKTFNFHFYEFPVK